MVKVDSIFSKVSETLTLNRYENGWMVEISGDDFNNEWTDKKYIFSDLKNVLTFIEDYSKINLR